MMWLNQIRTFDVYTKPVDDCRVKTSFGGLITLLCFVVIGILFISEIANYLSVEVSEQLFVDSTSSDMKVDIYFDITFYKLPCDFVSVDVMSLNGESQDSIDHDIFKQRLDSEGKVINGTIPEKHAINLKNEIKNKTSSSTENLKEFNCGSCYGAANGCCNTCADVQEVYRVRGWEIGDFTKIEQCKNEEFVKQFNESKGQGCRVYGRLDVDKVGGNLHVVPGHPKTKQNLHFHELESLTPLSFDSSHKFNQFSFGKSFPGKVYPLNGKHFSNDGKTGIMHQYFLKVVPTVYLFSITNSGHEELSHQFSITRREKDIGAGASGIPGLFIIYEFSPLMVRYQEKQKSFTNFAVSLCAIIGGVFTVASLLDIFVYSGSRAVQRKFQNGKAN